MKPRDQLVTVVTPSYNQGQFIRATIESVLSQDYPHIEYIIMDGGSTDETAAVVKDYASRLTFISERDRGQSHAINKGFQLARGEVVSWLNSDDLYLPGAVRNAVEGWKANPDAGAVYGDGYLIDRAGEITSRFPCTEPFNLWKLVHLSDYVLQQTVYFRKDVLDRIGYLNEDLNYTMDWDILIRIGLQYPLLYIPEHMGCLREYPEAKSFAGGMRRASEIRRLLRRHTGKNLAPGYLVYGLDTYQKILCDRIAKFCGPVDFARRFLQSGVRFAAGTIISRAIHHSQGLYPDGWAGRALRYMLPPGGSSLTFTGILPEWREMTGQTLRIYVEKQLVGVEILKAGEFEFTIDLPQELCGRTINLAVIASKTCPARAYSGPTDSRRLAYILKGIRWAEPPAVADGQMRVAGVSI